MTRYLKKVICDDRVYCNFIFDKKNYRLGIDYCKIEIDKNGDYRDGEGLFFEYERFFGNCRVLL
jgi:hypothetical protein